MTPRATREALDALEPGQEEQARAIIHAYLAEITPEVAAAWERARERA